MMIISQPMLTVLAVAYLIILNTIVAPIAPSPCVGLVEMVAQFHEKY